MYSNNADEQLPMASLTKIMTYIVAYENIPDIENARHHHPPKRGGRAGGHRQLCGGIQRGRDLHGLGYALFDDGPSGNNAALTLAKYVDQLYAEGKLDTSSQEESPSSGEESASGGALRHLPTLQRRLPLPTTLRLPAPPGRRPTMGPGLWGRGV